MLLDKLDDDDLLRIGSLPMVPFCEALLERNDKASSADLHEAWHALHTDPPGIPKTEFRRARDGWKQRGTTIGNAADEQESRAKQTASARDAAWAQLEAAIASGNTKKQTELMRTIKGLDALAPEHVAERGSEAWERLSDSERACLLALVSKLNGRALDEDGEWFIGLLARVPERPFEVHPAHITLPEANRPAMLTP